MQLLICKSEPVIKNCLEALYKPKIEKNWKLSVTIVSVQKQSDDYNCRLFGIAFVTYVLDELSQCIIPHSKY